MATTIDLRARNTNRENALGWMKAAPGNAIGDVLVVENGTETVSGEILAVRLFEVAHGNHIRGRFVLHGFIVDLFDDFTARITDR